MRLNLRQPVSGLTHLAGAISAIVGQVVLLTNSGSSVRDKLSLVVYSASLFLLFSASSIYHLISSTPRVTQVLRKLDHAAIYLLIAGSYTPFCVIAFHGFWRWGLLAIIWSLAVVGIGVKIWWIQAPRWLTAGVYVVLGWLVVLAYREILASLTPVTIGWLVAGGILYTVGALVYVTQRMDFKPGVFGFHEVWHIFVLLAAGAHFVAVYSLLHGMPG
jgi:hemolysin III